jgi:hypothetical protein
MGTLPAYLTAAFVPVVWVLLDLFVITRRFNFISSYAGLSAIMRGALAFWYVTGVLFALKDTASYVLAVLVFGGSAFLAKPVTRSIAFQGLAPESAADERALENLLVQPTVVRALKQAALIIGGVNFFAGIANFLINYTIVLAPFGTPIFNDQVANVNAITRVVLVVPDMLALFWAFSLMYKAMYALLPAEDGDSKDGENFWDLVQRREALLRQDTSAAIDAGAAVQSQANRQAREEFGLS